MTKQVRIIVLLFISNFTFEMNSFGQNSKKPYFENTLSPLNVIPRPGSGFKTDYWIGGIMNALMIKAGLNRTHVFRLGLSDYGNVTPFTKTLYGKNSSYHNYAGSDIRLGYQYNFKNDTRRSVPFISLDYLYTEFYEDYYEYPKWFSSNCISKGVLIGAGLKQKIWTVLVLNIESGLFIGTINSTELIYSYDGPFSVFNENRTNQKKMAVQFYPIKISFGVRIGDYKGKKI